MYFQAILNSIFKIKKLLLLSCPEHRLTDNFRICKMLNPVLRVFFCGEMLRREKRKQSQHRLYNFEPTGNKSHSRYVQTRRISEN